MVYAIVKALVHCLKTRNEETRFTIVFGINYMVQKFRGHDWLEENLIDLDGCYIFAFSFLSPLFSFNKWDFEDMRPNSDVLAIWATSA